MRFEWDTAKAVSNAEKHGVTFEQATEAWGGRTILFDLPNSTEQRTMALGVAQGQVIAVVYTIRGEAIRLISARLASRQERRTYNAAD